MPITARLGVQKIWHLLMKSLQHEKIGVWCAMSTRHENSTISGQEIQRVTYPNLKIVLAAQTETCSIHVGALNDYTPFKWCQTEHINTVDIVLFTSQYLILENIFDVANIRRNARTCFRLLKCDISCYLLAWEQCTFTAAKTKTCSLTTHAKCIAGGKSPFQWYGTFPLISTSSQGLARELVCI